MIGSGAFGEFIAIERLQVVAGSLIMLGMFAFLVMLMNGEGRRQYKLHGLTLIVPSALAGIIYIVCMTGLGLGWFEPGFRVYTVRENFIGSLLGIAMGMVIFNLPRLLDRIAAWRDRRHRNS